MEQKCDSSAPLDPTRPGWLHMGLRQNINILHHTLPTRANAEKGIGMHVMAVHMTPDGACSARSCKSSTTSFGWRCTSYLSTAALSLPQCHHVACLSSGSEPHAIGATGDRAITRCKHSALTQIDSGVCGSVCELESYEAPYGGTVIVSLSSGHLSLTP